MSTSSEQNHKASLLDDSFLELPDGSDFVSRHVTLPIDQVLKWCEEQLPQVNRDPKFKMEWTRDKVDVPFEL
jgi:hypothetical protein